MSDNHRHLSPAAAELLQLPIPPGWECAPIGELGEVRLGRQRSPKNRSGDNPTKYIRAANLTWNGLNLSEVLDMEFRPSEMNAYRLRAGDVILSEASGSPDEVGKPAIWNDEIENCCFQNTVIRFRPHSLSSKYAYIAFLHFALNGVFSRISKGVGIQHLSADRFSALSVLVPPVEEQRRIVAKIEELFSELDAGVAALKRVQANLKRYRSAVLKAAVEGRLTEVWRAEHQPKETGSELLARILKERRNKWEADQLASFAATGKTPPKGWQAKYKEPAAPDTSDLPSLPKGWCWVTVGQLLHGIEGGKSFKCIPRIATHSEWGVVKVSAMTWGTFLEEENKAIPPNVAFDPKHEIRPGDILISRSNTAELVGASVLVGECRSKLLLSDKSLRLLLVDGVHRGWFQKVLSSTIARDQLSEMATGTSDSMRNVSQEKIVSVVIPLPSFAEQAELFALISEQVATIEQNSIQSEVGLARADRLRQSILKQAFEGKLVPQDPTDEPASELLARIRQQRATPPATSSTPAAKPKKVTKDVFVRRAAIVSYIVSRLASRRSFGRTQLEKTLHLAQSHLGLDLQFAFERYKAGPFDKDIYKIEGVAKKQGWFTKDEPANGKVTYLPGDKIEPMCQSAVRQLADKRAAFDGLLDHIAGMTTDEAELFATAYAAWNDLLIDGRTADDAAIIAEVHGWHVQEKRFTPSQIQSRLAWMRKCGYVPTGKGERTQLASPATSKRRAQSKGKV